MSRHCAGRIGGGRRRSPTRRDRCGRVGPLLAAAAEDPRRTKHRRPRELSVVHAARHVAELRRPTRRWLAGLAAIIAGWMLHEQAQEAAVDRRVDAQRAAMQERETRLAERLAGEREGR